MFSRFILFLLAVSFTGCAALDLSPPKRWVEANRFFSTKSPSLAVEVHSSFAFYEDTTKSGVAEGDGRDLRAGVKKERYSFKGPGGKRLNFIIDSLSDTGRLYFNHPNFNKWGKVFWSDSQRLNNETFQTALLFVTPKGKKPVLAKVYSSLINDTTRLVITYAAPTSSDWAKVNASALPENLYDTLVEFGREADASFSLAPYIKK